LGLKGALRAGYRREPFPKTVIAVADPATEKLELQAKLKQKDGEIATLTDRFDKLQSMMEKVLAGQADTTPQDGAEADLKKKTK
jgi:hypothetical protein